MVAACSEFLLCAVKLPPTYMVTLWMSDLLTALSSTALLISYKLKAVVPLVNLSPTWTFSFPDAFNFC